MLSKDTTLTIGSKFIILLSNFSLVIFSTQTWGSEGRGEIALVLASISMITILSNVFCGSTVAFHAPGYKRDFLLLVSLAGAILISLLGTIVFSAFLGFSYFRSLFLTSLVLSMTTTISSYWLGKKNIKNYNLLTVLSPLGIVISLLTLFFIFKNTDINTYFKAYYTGAGIALLIGISVLMLKDPFKKPSLSFEGIKSIFLYGVNNEFNYLIQFLNYRLAYYFIALFLGLVELGIFSIVVSISEAVWIISRSLSVIHFSNVINSEDLIKSRSETIALARQSLWISLLILGFSVLIPQSVYKYVFGNEFGDVKKYILMLLPGIIAIAVSNLYGHYFAGTGKLRILMNKSLIGLLSTLILLPLLLKKYELTGACISLNVSYILSSLYLWFKFLKEENQLHH